MTAALTPEIRYVKSAGPRAAADYLGEVITHNLDSGKTVSWFLSGGSAIAVAVLTANRISPAGPELTVTLADERFGPEGHRDSNWVRLLDAGFRLPGANLIPILHGASEPATAAGFNRLAGRLLKPAAYRIALLGIGADGHTAGILPGSPAVGSGRLTCSYTGPDYHRLTLTARALTQLDEAVVYVQDEAKRAALSDLTKAFSADRQPAQILKRIPKVTIYSKVMGVWNEASD